MTIHAPHRLPCTTQIATVAPLVLLIIVWAFIVAITAASWKEMNDARQLQEAMTDASQITEAITWLQRERGTSCVYVQTSGDTAEPLDMVRQNRERSNVRFDVLKEHGVERINEVVNDLQLKRLKVDERMVDCNEIIDYYANLIRKLIDILSEVMRDTHDGYFWVNLMAYTMLIESREQYAIYRGIGTKQYSEDGMSHVLELRLAALGGAAKEVTRLAISFSPQANQVYQTQIQNHSMHDHIDKLLVREGHDLFQHTGDVQIDEQAAITWFANMTDYIRQFIKAESVVSELLAAALKHDLNELYLELLGLIILLCFMPPLVIFSTLLITRSKRLFVQIGEALTKSQNSLAQRTRAQQVLVKLLPNAAADALCHGKEPPKVTYQHAAIGVTHFKLDCENFDKKEPELFDQFLKRLDRAMQETASGVSRVDTTPEYMTFFCDLNDGRETENVVNVLKALIHIHETAASLSTSLGCQVHLCTAVASGTVTWYIAGNLLPRAYYIGPAIREAKALADKIYARKSHKSVKEKIILSKDVLALIERSPSGLDVLHMLPNQSHSFNPETLSGSNSITDLRSSTASFRSPSHMDDAQLGSITNQLPTEKLTD